MTTPRTKRKSAASPDAALSPVEDTQAARPDPAAEPDGVADLAYQLFLARGGGHGHDVDDWLEAERQLRRSHA